MYIDIDLYMIIYIHIYIPLLSRSSTIWTLVYVLDEADILKLSILKLSVQLRLKPQMAERLAIQSDTSSAKA